MMYLRFQCLKSFSIAYIYLISYIHPRKLQNILPKLNKTGFCSFTMSANTLSQEPEKLFSSLGGKVFTYFPNSSAQSHSASQHNSPASNKKSHIQNTSLLTDAHSTVILRKVIKETLFCYIFNLCVRRDLMDSSYTCTLMLNQKWLCVTEQFTRKRWLVPYKLQTENSQNMLHNEVAAVSETYSWCHIFSCYAQLKNTDFLNLSFFILVSTLFESDF